MISRIRLVGVQMGLIVSWESAYLLLQQPHHRLHKVQRLQSLAFCLAWHTLASLGLPYAGSIQMGPKQHVVNHHIVTSTLHLVQRTTLQCTANMMTR